MYSSVLYRKITEEQINFQMENSTKFVLTNLELQDNFGLPELLLKSKYCGNPVGHGTQIGQDSFPPTNVKYYANI